LTRAGTCDILVCTTWQKIYQQVPGENKMAYDEKLAQRIRLEMAAIQGIVEKKMFGGIGFLIHGNMACGVNGENLIVRVGPQQYEAALAEPHVGPFDMTGRPMTGWVVIAPEGCATEQSLSSWIQRGVAVAQSLPEK
jgi:TfoX/Sxy family transcriptional regulator of competence genes